MSRRAAGLALAVVAFLSLLVGAPLAADPHANVATGFSPEKSFQIGDVDHVNLFNGNLVVTLPIGLSYPVGGGFSHGLSLIHNSNPWFFTQRSDQTTGQTYTQGLPTPCSNAGLGWRVSFGEMNPPCTSSDVAFPIYEDASGADHTFFASLHNGEATSGNIQYTRDGTYLRLQTMGSDYELDFPDGSIHHFQHLAADARSPMRQRLVWMKDAFGNRVDVDYSVAGQWTIKDTPSGAASPVRTHTVQLVANQPGYAETVSEIDLAGLGKYMFAYTSGTIARACPNNDIGMSYGVTVPFLTALTLPDGSTYSMAPGDYSMPAVPPPYPQTTTTCGVGSGDILGLQLPTLGRVEWTYQTYKFPAANTPWRTKTQGLATRTTKDQLGAVLGQWGYTTTLSADNRELLNGVIDPLGQRTDHYFSVALDNSFSGWSCFDYGQPFTRNASIGATGPLYLSSRTFRANGTPFRTEYLRYERDQAGACSGGTVTLDYRVAKARTIYEDDGGVYAETDSTGFDGLGHYRTVATSGTFPAGNVRTHVTNYNPTGGSYNVDPDANTVTGGYVLPATWLPPAIWLLGNSNYHYDVENGVTGSFVETCFDASTGFLHKKRDHLATGAPTNAADVVTEYDPDTAGNVVAEKSFGGDAKAGIGLGNVCGFTSMPSNGLPATPEYEVDYTYQAGVRATARYVGASFYSLNQQISLATGLPSSSTDTTGVLTTTYGYDTSGRVTTVQPPQEAKTIYTYTPAVPAMHALAGVDIQRPGTGAEQQLVFDALGRVWHETQKLADGSFNVRETLYDGVGNKASVSELQTGNALQKTSFLNYDPAGRATLIRPADSNSTNNFVHDVAVTYAGARSVMRTINVGQTLAGGAVVESPSTTTEIYDRQGRLSQVTEPSGAGGAAVTTTYGYDVGNRLASVSTASAGVTQARSFVYDQRGFLLSETHPEKGAAGNGTVTYSLYDSRGHAERRVDGPHDLTYEYDPAERLVTVRETGPGFTACNQLNQPRCVKLFSYAVQNGPLNSNDNKNGKLFQSVRYNYPVLGGTQYQAFITETYHYAGVNGRVSQRDMLLTFALYGQPPVPSESFTESFAYDSLGNTSSIVYPTCTFTACAGTDIPRSVSFAHTNGFLTGVTGTATIGGMPSAATYASAITYWPNLMVAQVTHGNGVVDVQANDPNAIRRPQSIAVSSGMTALWKTDNYTYDGAGNITQIGADRFLYDGVSRLTSGSLVLSPQDTGTPVSQTYAYDAFGNIQSIGGTDARNTPTSSATNRLNGAGTTYDAAGNLTAWNGATYEYDDANQLKHYLSGSEEWLYMYDADDERLFSYKPGVPGTSVRFDRWTIRDLAGKVLRTYEASGYNWTGSDVEDSIYRDGVLLAAELPPTGTTRHFHLDHLGTPRLITDQNRVPVAYHVYYPFGEEATAFNQDTERMKFTGHERDLASVAGAGDDLDYMHARHFGPLTGRFLSIDQDRFISLQFGDDEDRARFQQMISTPQVWDLYSYSLDSPIKYIDRNGSSAELAVASSLGFVEEGAVVTLSASAAPVAAALTAGLGIGTLINRIPGVSQGIQEAFGRILDSIYLAQNNRHTASVISGLVGRAVVELGKIGSAGGPEKDPDFKHHREEVRAALQRASDLAKKLPGKAQDAALKAIQDLAMQAGVTIK